MNRSIDYLEQLTSLINETKTTDSSQILNKKPTNLSVKETNLNKDDSEQIDNTISSDAKFNNYLISSKKEFSFFVRDSNHYEEVKKRLEVGEKKIKEAGGFFKAPKKWVNTFQEMAEAMLMYEMENDLLPI